MGGQSILCSMASICSWIEWGSTQHVLRLTFGPALLPCRQLMPVLNAAAINGSVACFQLLLESARLNPKFPLLLYPLCPLLNSPPTDSAGTAEGITITTSTSSLPSPPPFFRFPATPSLPAPIYSKMTGCME